MRDERRIRDTRLYVRCDPGVVTAQSMAIHPAQTDHDPRGGRHARRSPLGLLLRLAGFGWKLGCVTIVLAVLSLAIAWKALGLVPLVVTSGSMSPGMPTGSLAFVREVPDSSIRVGDVITFDAPGKRGRVTHRVIERIQRNDRWYFRTKGDANGSPDRWREVMEESAGKSKYEPGFSYRNGTAIKRVFDMPYAGRLFAITSRPAVRKGLLYTALGLMALRILSSIWISPRVRTNPGSNTFADPWDEPESWDDAEAA